MTNLIFENTKTISLYKTCEAFPDVEVKDLGVVEVKADDGSRSVTVEVVSPFCLKGDVWKYATTGSFHNSFLYI